MIALVMIFGGLIGVFFAFVSMLFVCFLIKNNMEEAAKTSSVLDLSVKTFSSFALVLIFGSATIGGFIGVMALIEDGIKKWNYFLEEKK